MSNQLLIGLSWFAWRSYQELRDWLRRRHERPVAREPEIVIDPEKNEIPPNKPTTPIRILEETSSLIQTAHPGNSELSIWLKKFESRCKERIHPYYASQAEYARILQIDAALAKSYWEDLSLFREHLRDQQVKADFRQVAEIQ